MTEHDPVRAEVTVAAPAAAVWRALRDPAELRRWHGWEYDGLEAEIQEIFLSDVSASEADGTLDTGGGTFELEPRGERTIVRVAMPDPADDPVWNGLYAPISEGWVTFVHQLRFSLERHRGEDRRTVYLSGDARSTAEPHAADALGVPRLRAVPVGERYETPTATGETLAGEIFFRSEHQLGLSVDSWGDGLIVLTPSAAVITTYGLQDAAFAALQERWSAWWRG